MAGRYKNNEIKKLSDGRRVYRSKVYPNIPLIGLLRNLN